MFEIQEVGVIILSEEGVVISDFAFSPLDHDGEPTAEDKRFAALLALTWASEQILREIDVLNRKTTFPHCPKELH